MVHLDKNFNIVWDCNGKIIDCPSVIIERYSGSIHSYGDIETVSAKMQKLRVRKPYIQGYLNMFVLPKMGLTAEQQCYVFQRLLAEKSGVFATTFAIYADPDYKTKPELNAWIDREMRRNPRELYSNSTGAEPAMQESRPDSKSFEDLGHIGEILQYLWIDKANHITVKRGSTDITYAMNNNGTPIAQFDNGCVHTPGIWELALVARYAAQAPANDPKFNNLLNEIQAAAQTYKAVEPVRKI